MIFLGIVLIPEMLYFREEQKQEKNALSLQNRKISIVLLNQVNIRKFQNY